MISTIKKTIAIGIIILVAITLYNFTKQGLPKQTQMNQGRLQIMTSFYPLYFFTSQIVGDKAVVYNITPAGAEPHDYEPTATDMARLEDSQLLILNGNKLEPWSDNIQAVLKDTSTDVIVVGEDMANQTIFEDNNTIRDPHVWLDPILAKKEITIIYKKLSEIDPNNSSYYAANTKLLQNKLDSLDSQYRIGLKNCEKKDIITSHAAFGYLASEYGLRQVAISGLSPDEEPSSKQLTEVANFAKKNNIKYIFFESLVSPKLSGTIAQEIGAKTLVLNPIEGLTPTEIANGKTYFTEMEKNLTNIKTALQCL